MSIELRYPAVRVDDERLASLHANLSLQLQNATGQTVTDVGSLMCVIDEVVDRRKEELASLRNNQCWIEVVSSNGDSHYVSPYLYASPYLHELLCSPDHESARGPIPITLALRLASVFLDPNVVAVRIDPISYVDCRAEHWTDWGWSGFVRDEARESFLFSRESFDVSGPVLDDALRQTAILRQTIDHHMQRLAEATQRLGEAELALRYATEDAELKALAESTYQGDGDGI